MPFAEVALDRLFVERLRGLREPGDLVEMAAIVAAADGHEFDVAATSNALEQMAVELREVAGLDGSSAVQARALSDAFVRRLGFNGCETDYYNPRNSYLDQVVIRREGIPVSLALVYLELGRRLRMQLIGVNFPGHFLVAVLEDNSNEGVLIDPFGNVVLSQAECAERLRRQFGARANLQAEHFVRASRHGIAVRMLGNLKAIRIRQGDLIGATRLCSAALEVMPEHPGELSDRARLFEQIGRLDDAIDDLQRLRGLLAQEEMQPSPLSASSDVVGVDSSRGQRKYEQRKEAIAAIDARVSELRVQLRPIVH